MPRTCTAVRTCPRTTPPRRRALHRDALGWRRARQGSQRCHSRPARLPRQGRGWHLPRHAPARGRASAPGTPEEPVHAALARLRQSQEPGQVRCHRRPVGRHGLGVPRGRVPRLRATVESDSAHGAAATIRRCALATTGLTFMEICASLIADAPAVSTVTALGDDDKEKCNMHATDPNLSCSSTGGLVRTKHNRCLQSLPPASQEAMDKAPKLAVDSSRSDRRGAELQTGLSPGGSPCAAAGRRAAVALRYEQLSAASLGSRNRGQGQPLRYSDSVAPPAAECHQPCRPGPAGQGAHARPARQSRSSRACRESEPGDWGTWPRIARGHPRYRSFEHHRLFPSWRPSPPVPRAPWPCTLS